MNLTRKEKVLLAISGLFIIAGFVLIILGDNSEPTEVSVSIHCPDDDYPVEIINSASEEDFMNVPGIGKVKAADIVLYREALGGFSRVSQLKDVSGISDAIYSAILDYFYLNPPAETAVPEVTTVTEQSSAVITSAPESTEISKPAETKGTKKSAEKEKPATVQEEPEEVPKEEQVGHALKSVDINSADQSALTDSLGISEELAQKIIDLRDTIHRFSTVEELYLVDGMDKETYQRIKDFIVIG